MANLITDSFDWFPGSQASGIRDRLWAANGFFQISGSLTADVETGRFAFGKRLLFNAAAGSSGAGLHKGYVVPLGANAATVFIAGALFIYPDQSNNVATEIGAYDGVNDAAQLYIQFAANGVVKVLRGDGTLLANSVPGVFQENEDFHYEIKALIANSGGTCEVRINTVPVVQLVGADTQNTANAYADSAFIGYLSANSLGVVHYGLDDFVANDTTGAVNNTWIGNLRIYGMFMTANGYLNNFAIGGSSPAATHWQSVLNQLLDDTEFEFSANVGDIDAFVPNPVINGPLVRVLQMRAALRQDDATQRVGRLGVRISGTNYFGTKDQFTNQTFTFYKDKFELSPATSVTFTGSEANGCQALVKVQA